MSESNMQVSPGGIFICYRREDSADLTGRIYDRLVDHFGPERVFIDVEAIRLGYDFRSEIDHTIKVCSIVIVVIGDEWLAQVDGKRRIDDENDRVRIEIEAALRREIPIIPVLARGASHPTRALLPPSLEDLAYRHGTSIRHEHFRGDVDSLIKQMDKLLARRESTPSKPAEPKEPREIDAGATSGAPPVSLGEIPTRAAAPELNSRAETSQQDSVATAKEPTPPVKSAQTTLITTFIRNMLLNWLVLVSWLAAAMMIPRLYLAAIMVSPNWAAATDEASTLAIIHWWNFPLNTLLAVGFALIAMAMAYAVIDVPSMGNARFPQRRFLKFRQLPLLLTALVLAEWWALFRNVHGSEPFQAGEWWPKFVAFFVASYLCGGVLAVAILWYRANIDWSDEGFRKRKQKAERGRPTHSLWRLGTIALAAAVAGSCVWVIATRMFLEPPIQFTLSRDCEATPIPSSKQKIVLPTGTHGVITQIEMSYAIETNGQHGRIGENDLGTLKLKPGETLPIQFTLKRDCEAIPIPWRKQKMWIPAGTQVVITQADRRYTIETSQVRARITEKDLNALVLKPNETLPARFPIPAPARNAIKYVCFAPALILAVLLLVNFLFGLASWVSEDEDRKWWGRSAAWILITIFGWIVVNVIVLWGAQTISATPNRLGVFLGDVKATATPQVKGLLGAFGGVTGIVIALLAIRSKLSNKFGEKAGFQWLLIVVAVVFFVLLCIVFSWVLVLIGAQPWAQQATAWLLGGRLNQIADPNSWQVQLFVVVFLTGAMLLFGIVIGFFINANKRV